MKRNKFLTFLSFITLLGFTASSPIRAESTSSQLMIENLLKQSIELAKRTKTEVSKFSTRLNHAKELLGKNYYKSIVKSGERISNLDDLIYSLTERSLRKQWKKQTERVSKTIAYESEKYGFDPIFLMAVIQNESSFDPEILGTHGEIGLMQIIPETGEWISEKYNLPWKGSQSLKDPVINIQIGAAYLAYLREKFEFHSQLYLAAYNMGSTNVKRAIERQILPKQYPFRVMQRYVKFYSKIHEEITN